MAKTPGKKISAKTHLKGYGLLQVRMVALCDAEPLGKVLKQGEVVLDLKNYEHFYSGEKLTHDEAVALLKNADNINAVGEAAVGAAMTVFKFDGAKVKRVQGVPHMQIYKL